MIITYILIVILILLISHTLIKKSIIEGATNSNNTKNSQYQNYSQSQKTAYMLAQKNAANISVLLPISSDKPAKSLLSASALALSKFNCLPVSNSASISA